MKRKLTLILLTCLACLALVGSIVLTACTDNSPTYAITWNVDEHVTVKADGYDTLPEAVKENTEIAFTVTPDNGYEISSVAPSSIKKDGEKYVLTVVDKDVTVTIRATRAIDSVTATLKDANKIYYAGDTITTDDLNVTVKYKDDQTETVTQGISVVYEKDGGEALAIGDKKITVSYRGHNADITLPLEADETGVVALVTIDTVGGALSEAYLNKIKDQAHYAYDKTDGVATFTHKGDLPADGIALPALGTTNVDGEVTKGEEGDYTLKGWTDGKKEATKITNDTVSATYTLVYEANLLILEKVYYELEGGVPYLVIKGTFKAADKAYLYLYEGKKEIELKGDEVTKAEKNEFELKFDMTKLVDAGSEYEGAFMDLKFRAEFGSRVETQAINLEDYEGIADFVDTNQSIKFEYKDSWYKAEFRVWTEDGGHDLKVVYVSYLGYEVTDVTLEEKGEKPYVVLEGVYELEVADEAALEAAIKALYIDWQNNNGANGNGWGTFINNGDDTVKTVEVTYSADGAHTFKITFDISVLQDGDVAFSHFGTSSKNLEVVIEEDSLTIDTITYTLKNWDGWGSNLVCIFVDDAAATKVTTTDVKLEAGEIDGDDVAFLVFSGTWKFGKDHVFNEEEDLAALKAMFTAYSVQTSSDWSYLNGCSDNQQKAENTVFVIHENGTFEVKIALNGAGADSYWYLHYQHTGKSNGDVGYSLYTVDKTPITVNGQTFSFFDTEGGTKSPDASQDWLKERLIVHVEGEDTSAIVYTVTSYELEDQDGTAVMVVKGTVENYREGKKVYIATVLNEDPWTTKVHTEYATIVVDNGEFTVTWDLSSIVPGGTYYIHFGGASIDLPGNTLVTEKYTVTVGTATYTISDYEKDGSPLITAVNTAAPTKTVKSVDLKVDGEEPGQQKLLYVITYTYENYTKEALEAELSAKHLNFDLQANNNISGQGWGYYATFTATYEINDDDKELIITIDLSSIINLSEGAYTSHFEIGDNEQNTTSEESNVGEFKPGLESVTKEVTFGEYKVTLKLVKDGGDNDFWGCVGFILAAATV